MRRWGGILSEYVCGGVAMTKVDREAFGLHHDNHGISWDNGVAAAIVPY